MTQPVITAHDHDHPFYGPGYPLYKIQKRAMIKVLAKTRHFKLRKDLPSCS